MVLCFRVLRNVLCCLSLVGTALCRSCLEEFEDGPFGPEAQKIPLYPRALSKFPGIVHAEVQIELLMFPYCSPALDREHSQRF